MYYYKDLRAPFQQKTTTATQKHKGNIGGNGSTVMVLEKT
jgi:hypothetical protein